MPRMHHHPRLQAAMDAYWKAGHTWFPSEIGANIVEVHRYSETVGTPVENRLSTDEIRAALAFRRKHRLLVMARRQEARSQGGEFDGCNGLATPEAEG